MQAVILAAGEGRRMRPLTYTRPKAMLPLVAKPLLQHLITELKDAGINHFIVVTGYCSDKVREYFGNGDAIGVRIDYVMQTSQSGTADALKAVDGLVDDCFLVVNGDVYIESKDIINVLSKEDATMGLLEIKDAVGVGVVDVRKGKVRQIYEKVSNPPSNLVNCGVYLLTREIFDIIAITPKSRRGEYELTDSLQLMIDKGCTLSYQMVPSWFDLSYPWDLLVANERMMPQIKSRNEGIVEKNALIRGPVVIGEGTIIRAGAYIIGPVIIGNNCDIGPNCYIRPCTTIGNDCHIGNAVEVKNSIIMDRTKIPHHNYIGDSVIGENCNFGAGTKIANLRLDKNNVDVAGIKTERRKLGAIVGDRVETGINSSLNVGTMIGNDTFIGPGVVVGGIVQPNTKII